MCATWVYEPDVTAPANLFTSQLAARRAREAALPPFPPEPLPIKATDPVSTYTSAPKPAQGQAPASGAPGAALLRLPLLLVAAAAAALAT